jgi:gamma-glutamyltranspeptidase / glutathione hydrolase
LTEGDQPLGPFGVMGAHMQPQGHVQMAVNLMDYGMNPQAALDAPRWHYLTGKSVLLEQSVSRSLALALSDRGHAVQVIPEVRPFGKGQMILRQNGVLVAASEPRADGVALAG